MGGSAIEFMGSSGDSGTSGQWGAASTAQFFAAGDDPSIVTALNAGDLLVLTGVITPATVTADGAPTLPLTITEGSNDTFVFTGQGGGGSPETFTMTNGATATTLAELEAIVGAASGTDSDTFSDYVTTTDNGTNLVFTMVGDGADADNGNTITEGDGGAVAVGVTSPPATFANGNPAFPGLYQSVAPGNESWGQVGPPPPLSPVQIGFSSPVGSVTPNGVQLLYLWEGSDGEDQNTLYLAVGPTSADWVMVNGYDDPTALGFFASDTNEVIGWQTQTNCDFIATNSKRQQSFIVKDPTEYELDHSSVFTGANTLDDGTTGNNAVFVGGFSLPGLPTSDPAVAGALWNNSGVLTISAG